MEQPVKWHVAGDFFGNCSCTYMRCPCPISGFTELPNMEWCKLCIVFDVTEGYFGDLPLAGLAIAMVADVPGAMGEGNWALGLIVDERATPEQQNALAMIMGGAVGGPMASAAAFIGTFLGMESRPMTIEKTGKTFSVFIPDMVDYMVEKTAGVNPDEPIYFDNTFHPANMRFGVGRGKRSHLHAFGIDFDGIDDRQFGVFTGFNWSVN